MSNRTRWNWLIDAAVFASGLIVAVTSVYFLTWPTGRSSGAAALWGSRATWDDWHLWSGVAMIAAAAVHLGYHWSWVKSTVRRVRLAARTGKGAISSGAKLNIAVDCCIALGFLVAAVTGVYFILAPTGGYQGGRNPGWDPGILFSRTTWDALHTWGGTVMLAAALVHFYLHWGWVRKVTANLFRQLASAPQGASVPVKS